MRNIIGVRFKPVGKVYYFDPMKFNIKKGDPVIVETSRGVEFGTVVLEKRVLDDKEFTKPLKGVLRLANEQDIKKYNANKKKEKEAFRICLEKIKDHGLDMKLIDAEYTFDGSKILFHFTAEGRVDFRELVRDLATVFKTRIELRQIGVRDECKIMGNIGICGRPICCSTFLGEFIPVSIKMAKEQGLSLNPTKISGSCGRLMCCLKYEQAAYEDLRRHTPTADSVVKTPDGKGIVDSVNLLKGTVKVRLESRGEQAPVEFPVKDVTVLKKSGHHNKSEKIDTEILKTLED